ETPQVTGLTNTAWVPGQTQPVSGRAATEDQLKHVDDQVASGLRMLVERKVDYTNPVNMILTSVILVVGLSGAELAVGKNS
ncbi:hypothetical protein NE583_10365, partial [Veillonella parvula]